MSQYMKVIVFGGHFDGIVATLVVVAPVCVTHSRISCVAPRRPHLCRQHLAGWRVDHREANLIGRLDGMHSRYRSWLCLLDGEPTEWRKREGEDAAALTSTIDTLQSSDRGGRGLQWRKHRSHHRRDRNAVRRQRCVLVVPCRRD